MYSHTYGSVTVQNQYTENAIFQTNEGYPFGLRLLVVPEHPIGNTNNQGNF